MTGRYAVRTGNGSVPIETPRYGLVQWEITLPKMLSKAGYVSGMFGNWHLGHTEGRFPTDLGFDEWYGIPNSTDEAYWADNPQFRPTSDPYAHAEQVMEARKGEVPKKLKVYNLAERRVIDRELTDKAKDFISRQGHGGQALLCLHSPHHGSRTRADVSGV
jgi:arylsulfatase A-like enzyme